MGLEVSYYDQTAAPCRGSKEEKAGGRGEEGYISPIKEKCYIYYNINYPHPWFIIYIS